MEFSTDHPKLKGEISQAVILAELVKAGLDVLLPFGDSSRYDLVVDFDKHFVRVQCKTAHIEDEVVSFSTCSSTLHTKAGSRRNYRGEADYFGVFCPEIEKVYLVPVEDCGDTEASLRLTPTKSGQKKGIKMAEDYEVPGVIPNIKGV